MLYIYVLLAIILSQKICRYQKKNLLEKIFCARLNNQYFTFMYMYIYLKKKKRKEGKLMFGQWAQ